MRTAFSVDEKITTTIRWSWVLLLLIFLVYPLTGLSSTPDPYGIARVEKRLPAKFPEKILDKEVFKKFEWWFGDHYPHRYALVRLFSETYAYMAGTSIRSSDVLVGKDGWLYLGNRFQQVMSRYRGYTEPSVEQIEAAVMRYAALYYPAQTRGIPVVIAIAPDKQRISPEFLPEWALSVSEPGILRIQHELEQQGIPLLWLLQATQEAREYVFPLPVALEYDSHWNGASAFFAFKAVMHELSRQRLGGFIPDEKNYVFNIREGESDLTKILMLPEKPSTDVYAEPSAFEVPRYVLRRTLRDEAGAREVAPQIPEHVRGESAPVETQNPLAPNSERVLFIADSFGTAMEPYFIQHFASTIRVSTAEMFERGVSLDNLITQFSPSVIVFLTTERNAW